MNIKRFQIPALIVSVSLLATACNNSTSSQNQSGNLNDSSKMATDSGKIKEESVSYSANGTTMNGYVTYDENKQGKRPAILIVHEWWGLTDYPRMSANELAKMGYVAMAVDMYGNGKTAADPKEAQALATPFYKDPQLAKTRLDAALQKLKTYPQVDTANIAAIGYCYGGYVVLNAAKLGEPLKGVVSFHGDLSGVAPDKKLLTSKILVCHGADDKFVNQQAVDKFKHQMDSVGADYTFKSYPNATHAFTNPASTENGKKFNMPIAYNAEADKNSWNDMKEFFNKLFK
jgi:dienelactone hydrolase